MGACLWHGTITAQRWAMPCPKCTRAGAVIDTDALGQTVIRCRSCGPFLMPTSHGGTGMEWPIDLRTLPPDDGAPIDPADTARQCLTEGCFRKVGPRSRHCHRCAADAAQRTHTCAEPGCGTIIPHRASRCPPCARERIRRNLAARARARRAQGKQR